MSGRYITDPIALSDLLLSDRLIAGDTIIKLSDVIDYDVDFSFSGSADKPIIFKPITGKSIFNGGQIYINGNNLRFENIEFSFIDWVKRDSEVEDHLDIDLTKTFSVFGYNIEFYRCFVHDFLDVEWWSNVENTHSKFTECIIYYNGWNGISRGHGYNFYAQNEVGKKTLERCILFSSFRNNLHMNSSTKTERNWDIIDCILFGAGSPSIIPSQVNEVLMGSGVGVTENIHFLRNEIYGNSRMVNDWGIFTYFQGHINNYSLIGNYFNMPSVEYGSDITFLYDRDICTNGVINGNYFYGVNSNDLLADFPDNEFGLARTSGKRTRVIKCDGNAAHIVIYNYDLSNVVEVDLTGILITGDNYKLINVQDYKTDIQTGIVGNANKINISMTGRTTSNPVMGTNYDVTFPGYGVFIIEKI